MKNSYVKTIGATALAILMLAVSPQILVFAQVDSKTENQNTGLSRENSSEENEHSKTLVGSWDVQVTIRNCQNGAALVSFPALITFNEGGTMQETANDAAPLLRSPGHGAWSRRSGRTYTAAFRFFRYNANGTFAGKNIIRQTDTLGRSGDVYSTTDTVDVLDANGNLLDRVCATSTGIRFE